MTTGRKWWNPVPAGAHRRRSIIGIFLTVALLVVSAAAPSAAQGPDTASQGASADRLDGDFAHGTVKVGGGTTVHYVMGGSGPPVVLLHGWPQTWWIWHKVMPDLAENHTVIAIDLPGLGESSPSHYGYEKSTTAKQIRKAVRKLGFKDKVDIVGHDVGALIAYPYARQFPNDVNRVAVLDTPLTGFGLEEFYGISWHFLFNMSPAPIPEHILDDEDVPVYLGMMFEWAADPNAVDKEVYFDAYSDPLVRSAGYEYYRAYPADAVYNQEMASEPITMPVLAMGGEFTFGLAVGESFSNVATDVRPVVAPGSAHYIAEEDPQFLAACLKLFLGPTDGVPSSPELAGCAP